MELILNRFAQTQNETIGFLHIDGEPQCFTLEDEFRAVKVQGETRIPAGRYRIKFREELSDKTREYRAKFGWFTWHLELQEVPGFKYVYIHIGNNERNTDGCILVGNKGSFIANTFTIEDSTTAFMNFYRKVSHEIKDGHEVWITVKD